MTIKTFTAQFFGSQHRTGDLPRVATFKATQNADRTWYATGLGCSRDYATPEAAVLSLLNAECAIVIGDLVEIIADDAATHANWAPALPGFED